MTVYSILGILFGLPLGIGAALYIMATILDKSNNYGDTTANIHSFSRGGILGKVVDDRAKASTPLDPIQNPNIKNLDSAKKDIERTKIEM